MKEPKFLAVSSGQSYLSKETFAVKELSVFKDTNGRMCWHVRRYSMTTRHKSVAEKSAMIFANDRTLPYFPDIKKGGRVSANHLNILKAVYPNIDFN